MFRKYKSLRHFKSCFLKHKSTIRFAIFVMITASSLGMLLPYFISKRLMGIAETSFNMVLKYSVIIMSVTLLHHIFWYFWEKIISVLTNNIAVDIRKDIITKFINTKYSNIKHKTSGFYLERINDDTTEVSSFLSNILGICADCLTNFSFLALIYFFSYQCGLIFTASILLMYVIEFVKIKINIKYVEVLKELNEKFNSKVNENYNGIKDIKGLGIKSQIIADTDAISKDIAQTQIKKDKIFALLSRCKTFTQYLTDAVLIIYSVGMLIPAQAISVIVLLTIINYGGFMYDLVGYLAQIKDWFVRGELKASRLLEVLSDENVEKFGDANELHSYEVEIDNLTYLYESGEAVLQNISLAIAEKSATVFIGASGSGKTTLFSVLSGLLQCENGKVFIGTRDINELSENCIKENICIIHQEPFLLNDSILNNIKIVKPRAALREVEAACKKAHIYDEICSFENGFYTVVAENGSNLSTGQKQRISIARALLKNSSILLFDEPTSSLDRANQELFVDTIMSLKSEKTILIIAHKLGDYTGFDNVYEVINGELIKQV